MNLTESVQDESSTTHPGKGAAENHHNYRKRLAGFVKALTDDDIEQDYHYHQLWKAYAAYNLEEAIEHASALSSEAAKQRALKSVFMDWASRDPNAAIMFLRDPSSNAQYFGDDTRTKLFTQSYRQWLSSQAADAFSTAARSTASSEKYAFLRLASEMSPKETIDVLPRLLLDRQANEAALYKAIQAWAHRG